MSTHLHHFNIPLEGEPHARRCACGERQRYNPPTGSGFKFTDVLIEADDLRVLISAYRGQAAMPDEGVEALCDRLELLLLDA